MKYLILIFILTVNTDQAVIIKEHLKVSDGLVIYGRLYSDFGPCTEKLCAIKRHGRKFSSVRAYWRQIKGGAVSGIC